MPVFLTMLLPLLQNIPGLFGDYFKKQSEIELSKLDTEKQVELAKGQMAQEIARTQLELNKTIVQSTSSYFKYFTFIMWFGPFMMGVVSPRISKAVFDNMGTMPEWYVQSCMLIMFTVWGISASAPVVSNIFSGLGNFFQGRRDFKLQKALINRKDFYDALRKAKGTVTPQDIVVDDAVLNELDKGS